MSTHASTTILHLTHTDVACDNRILKELAALAGTGRYSLHAVGLSLDEGATHTATRLDAEIETIELVADRPRRFPRPIRPLLYALTMIELSIRMLWRGLRLKPRVVHCHDTMVLPAGVLIRWFTGSKLIYDAHELESDKNGQSPLLSKVVLLIERLCWRRVDLLISVSPSIVSWYHMHLGIKDSALILNAPLIVSGTKGDVDPTYADRYFHGKYGIPEDRLVFVYLGILGHGRSIDLFLDVFSQPDIKSHVVFVGYGDFASRVASYADRCGNIHLHSPVPHESVVALVKHADVGLCIIENVSLSDYYCLPNKLFECVFAGLPILASRFPDIETLVEQYSLGVCCDISAEAIAREIRLIELHPLKRVAANLSELGWDAQAVRLVDAYSRLLCTESAGSN